MSDDYEELRQALLDGPRAGPWCLSEYTDDRNLIVCDAEGFDVGRISYPQRNGTARYIAAANPETVSRLLAEIDRLRDENESLREELDRVLSDWNGLVYVLGVNKYGAALDHARALRQDAERWRFMRANYGHMTADMLGGKLRIHVEPRRWGVVSPEDADAAIDAARKASGSPD